MKFIPILFISAILVYGGICDYKRREIPNAVPIVVVIAGLFFDFSPVASIIGLVLTAVVFLIAAKLTKSEMPGGDFKLLCALGFACGLGELAIVILISGAAAVLVAVLKQQPMKRHIPLCTYAAPSYIILQIAILFAEGVVAM